MKFSSFFESTQFNKKKSVNLISIKTICSFHSQSHFSKERKDIETFYSSAFFKEIGESFLFHHVEKENKSFFFTYISRQDLTFLSCLSKSFIREKLFIRIFAFKFLLFQQAVIHLVM